VSEGPEQTTAETVSAADEASATGSAVPENAAAEAAGTVEAAPGAPAPAAATSLADVEPGAEGGAEAEAGQHVPAAEPVIAEPAAETHFQVHSVEVVEGATGTEIVETVVETTLVETSVVAAETVLTEPVEAAPVEAAPVEAVAVETVAVAAAYEAPIGTSDEAAAPVAEAPVAVVEASVAHVVPMAPVSETPTTEMILPDIASVAEAAAVDAEVVDSVVETPAAAVEIPAAEAVVAEAAETEAASPADEAAGVPVAVSAAEPAAPAVPAAPAPTSSQWGRVTEEGIVFAIGADGTEREIGNWAAGSPADGFAFYERKFASLKGEVDLLNKRVHGPGLSAKDAEATIAKLRESLADAHVIGDLAALSARLDKIGRIAEQKQAARKEARAKLQAEAAVTKEALVSEAESLAESQQWKSAGERLRILVDEWKAAPRLDRKADDELWSRFAAARGTFAKRRKAHFAQLDAQRDEVKSRKESLVDEAESMAESTDWAETAQRFRNLMQQWKTAGRAQRETEDKLWGRFKTAQDTFFAARNADLDQRDAGFKENAVAKEALIAEAQKLVPVTDVKAAKSALRSIHTRWESIGMVPRDDKGRIEGALRDVERAVSEAEQAEWKRTNPEARARAQATVDQLRTSISKFEKELSRATEANQPKKIADAEAAIAARQEWLAQAQAALDEFTR
jgi:Domain of Unknown Function (DUF349)